MACFVCSGCWALKGSCVLVYSQRRAIKMTGWEGGKCVHTGRWRIMIWAQDMTQSVKCLLHKHESLNVDLSLVVGVV